MNFNGLDSVRSTDIINHIIFRRWVFFIMFRYCKNLKSEINNQLTDLLLHDTISIKVV